MPTPSAFTAFLAAVSLLAIAPGPDMLYVIGRSVGQGRRAGVISALGIWVGCHFHIFAAAAGLAAVLRSSPLAYSVVRYAGAAYLIYLGIRILTGRASSLDTPVVEEAPLGRIFLQGVITNILNPKVAIFFVAFLPQFVDPRRGSVVFQIILLGMIFNACGTLVNLAVAQAGGRLGDWLKRSRPVAQIQKWFTGSIFLGLGVRVALKRS